jgi:hypothetical protein
MIVMVTKTYTVTREQARENYDVDADSPTWPQDIIACDREYFDNGDLDIELVLDLENSNDVEARFEVTGMQFE